MSKRIFRIILLTGAFGDHLLTTPTFKALKEQYPGCKVIVFSRYLDRTKVIFGNNPYIDSMRSTSFWASPVSYTLFYLKKARFYIQFFGTALPSFYCGKDAKEIYAEKFDVELKDNNIQIFLTKEEERHAEKLLSAYKNPIVIHITSRFSKNQEWPVKKWEELIASMPGYTFIQLGFKDEFKVENAVDFRGKTTFRETVAILKYAKSFVGVVSSISHATNAFGVPGVVLFGASNPHIWGHANNINLYKGVRCAPCIDLLMRSECPYGRYCITDITVEEVKQALLKQLETQNV